MTNEGYLRRCHVSYFSLIFLISAVFYELKHQPIFVREGEEMSSFKPRSFLLNDISVCEGDDEKKDKAEFVYNIEVCISNEGAIVIAVVVAIAIATNSLNIQSAIALFKSIDSDIATALLASAISVSMEIASANNLIAAVAATASAAVAAMQPTQFRSTARHFLKHFRDIRWIAAALLLYAMAMVTATITTIIPTLTVIGAQSRAICKSNGTIHSRNVIIATT